MRKPRIGSPVGGSTLMTVAPMSERIPPATGTKAHIATSTTLMPSSGLPIGSELLFNAFELTRAHDTILYCEESTEIANWRRAEHKDRSRDDTGGDLPRAGRAEHRGSR